MLRALALVSGAGVDTGLGRWRACPSSDCPSGGGEASNLTDRDLLPGENTVPQGLGDIPRGDLAR